MNKSKKIKYLVIKLFLFIITYYPMKVLFIEDFVSNVLFQIVFQGENHKIRFSLTPNYRRK